MRPTTLILSSRAYDDTGPIGGGTGFLRALAQAAPPDWMFFTPLPSQGGNNDRRPQPHLGPSLQRTGIPRRIRFPFRLLRHLSQIRRLNPGIIYSHENEGTFLVTLARSLGYFRCAVVHHQHGSVNPLLRATYGIGRLRPLVWLYQRLLRWTHRQCDLIIAIDRDCVRTNEEWGLGDRTLLLPNAVNTEFFSPSGAASSERLRERWQMPYHVKILISIGRLEKVKRYDLLIRAFSEFQREDVLLVIVGDGTQRQHLDILAGTSKKRNRIRLLGNQPAPVIRDLLQMSDVFVLLSEFEGVPLVVLEALATGLPIVATRVGGLPDLIPDDRIGILVDPQATLAEITRAFHEACNKAWDRKPIRAWGESFSAVGAVAKLTVAFSRLDPNTNPETV